MAKSPAWQKKPRNPKLPDCGVACTVCSKTAPAVKFDKSKVGYCNGCYKKEWGNSNPIKLRAQRLYGNAQKRAKQMGWPVPDFDSVWIENKILSGVCEVTGIKFNLTDEFSKSVHAKNPWVPSIDRIDSSKPYIKDNVQLVVFMYNVCKGEFNHNAVVDFCKAVANKQI